MPGSIISTWMKASRYLTEEEKDAERGTSR